MDQRVTYSGGHAFATCAGCGKAVKLTKFLFGSMHVCRTDEELAMARQQQDAQLRAIAALGDADGEFHRLMLQAGLRGY